MDVVNLNWPSCIWRRYCVIATRNNSLVLLVSKGSCTTVMLDASMMRAHGRSIVMKQLCFKGCSAM